MTAWRKDVIKMIPVVRVCAVASANGCRLRKRKLTLNNRGGMMDDRVVKISFIAARINSVNPTQRNAIVSADDPLRGIS